MAVCWRHVPGTDHDLLPRSALTPDRAITTLRPGPLSRGAVQKPRLQGLERASARLLHGLEIVFCASAKIPALMRTCVKCKHAAPLRET
jgi:hypothetical protein